MSHETAIKEYFTALRNLGLLNANNQIVNATVDTHEIIRGLVTVIAHG